MTAEDVEILRQAGFEEVIAAVLDGDDIEENEAAARIAERLGFAGATARPPATGRVNIFAHTDGIFTVDRALVDAVNRVDPDVTLATLAEYAPVTAGQMVATVKIIPFAVKQPVLDRVLDASAGRQALPSTPTGRWRSRWCRRCCRRSRPAFSTRRYG